MLCAVLSIWQAWPRGLSGTKKSAAASLRFKIRSCATGNESPFFPAVAFSVRALANFCFCFCQTATWTRFVDSAQSTKVDIDGGEYYLKAEAMPENRTTVFPPQCSKSENYARRTNDNFIFVITCFCATGHLSSTLSLIHPLCTASSFRRSRRDIIHLQNPMPLHFKRSSKHRFARRTKKHPTFFALHTRPGEHVRKPRERNSK